MMINEIRSRNYSVPILRPVKPAYLNSCALVNAVPPLPALPQPHSGHIWTRADMTEVRGARAVPVAGARC